MAWENKTDSMKKILMIVVPFFAIAMMSSCGPTADDAVTYNNAIVQELDRVMMADSVIASMEQDKAVMDATEKNLIAQLNSAIETIKKNGGFDKGTELMDAAMNYLTSYKSVAETIYKEMIEINSKPLEKLTEDDDARYKELQDMCNTKMEKVSDQFDSIQKVFAEKYKFEIEGVSSPTK